MSVKKIMEDVIVIATTLLGRTIVIVMMATNWELMDSRVKV